MSAQRWAALWHWLDAALLGAAFLWALGGLYGHYRLRKYHVVSRALANA